MKRIISLLLAAVLLGGVVLVILLPKLQSGDEPVKQTELTGIVGADQAAFFANPTVKKRLEDQNITVETANAESVNVSHEMRFGTYDFVWTDDQAATQTALDEANDANAHSVGTKAQFVSLTPNGVNLATILSSDATLKQVLVPAPAPVDPAKAPANPAKTPAKTQG